MGGFRVDLGALESAAEGIDTVLYDLQSRRVSDLKPAGDDVGHGPLADLLADFCDRWELGVENLAKDGQAIAVRLSQAVANYLKVDTAAAGRLDGILQAGDGPDPAAQP
jgi:hypothetical protein